MVNEAVLEGYDVVTEERPLSRPRKKGPLPSLARSTATWSGWWTWARAIPWSSAAAPTCPTLPRWGCSTSASEFSVASGVRRIEATTGKLSLEVMNRNQELLFQAAEAMKAKPGELREKAAAAMAGDQAPPPDH